MTAIERNYHKTRKILSNDYSSFDQLNGDHPWMKAVPEGAVTYKVQELPFGKITYFNFTLAKEMGLISENHPHKLTEELEKTLIKTFSIQIINEYDELNQKRIPTERIKANRYMATRYLQLQHDNKQGKTSGDGRGIWNGVTRFKGTTWDVSSRGTGVTCLAPGSVQANRPLKTGGTDFGYGCGLAEMDELLGAAILAESMHLQGVETERVLCIIDHDNGHGIGVRAAKNLIRPAHLFLFLKQGKLSELKRATDYFIDRQVSNRRWNIKQKDSKKYIEMLEHVNHSFAEFSAILDVEYIFAWLDWDGDNVLGDAGIIDYGSIRQFGIRHDKYRYDDVERFSTNLNEQKNKAKLIVQVFIQMTDFLMTGIKKPLKSFKGHPLLIDFDKTFEKTKEDRLLYRMGFEQGQRQTLLKSHQKDFDQFQKLYEYFERAKISGKPQKVADGINHPALFNMRKILRELPKRYDFTKKKFIPMSESQFYKLILSKYAKQQDTRPGNRQIEKIKEFQETYFRILEKGLHGVHSKNMMEFIERAKLLNGDDRITGNGLVEIVSFLLEEKSKALPENGFQKIIDKLVSENLKIPENKSSKYYEDFKHGSFVRNEIYRGIRQLRLIHKEEI